MGIVHVERSILQHTLKTCRKNQLRRWPRPLSLRQRKSRNSPDMAEPDQGRAVRPERVNTGAHQGRAYADSPDRQDTGLRRQRNRGRKESQEMTKRPTEFVVNSAGRFRVATVIFHFAIYGNFPQRHFQVPSLCFPHPLSVPATATN